MQMWLSFLVLLLAVLMLSFSNAEEEASFVRWGKKSCPGNTLQVYEGFAAGKHYTQKGSGINRLCMTLDPIINMNWPIPKSFGKIYGAEYRAIPSHTGYDVPCSVCWVGKPTVMVPGTFLCPQGWTFHYSGYLASEHKDHFGSEYVCLDHSPDLKESHHQTEHDFGNLFYFVYARCGSLPCPPYKNNQIVTCVVCSK